nr:hypothetical protein [Candidatus Sigynarchaeum springense]
METARGVAQQGTRPMVVEAGTVPVEYGMRYAPNAGECDKCHYWRTWDFKVENPRTGKMIPGHVTRDGYKVGDGGCPYWQAVMQARAARPSKLDVLITGSLATGIQPALGEQGGQATASTGQIQVVGSRVLDLGDISSLATRDATAATSTSWSLHGVRIDRVGDHVVVALGGRTAAFSSGDAIKLAGAILDLVARKHGS